MFDRDWMTRLWLRSLWQGRKAGWTFRQAIKTCEGLHMFTLPADLPGMPRTADDVYRRIADVPVRDLYEFPDGFVLEEWSSTLSRSPAPKE
jgi:hypothetical protein